MDETCDRLSSLPEPLLTSILSMIPTKQAATTSILSKKWRYLWHSTTHLHLSHETLLPTSDDDNRSTMDLWESMLDSIERSVQGPIVSCRVSFSPSNHTDYFLRLNAFILSVIGKGVKEMAVVNRGTGCYELPSESFFCRTLEKLELGKCMLSILPQYPSSSHMISNIRSLILFRVHFTNDQFREMISRCQLLESLTVDCCVKVRHLHICTPKLSSLEITTLKPIRISLKGITHLRQASLKFLLAFEDSYIPYCDDSSREEDADQADKLIQLLIDLSQSNVERLSLRFCRVFSEYLQRQRTEVTLGLPPQYQLRQVKKLNLHICLSNLQIATVLSCLLSNCPNLCELEIEDKEHLDTNRSFWENYSPLSTLDHLRIIQIRGVNLCRSYWIGFVSFLLMNACVCERITLHCIQEPWQKKVMEQKLRSFQWASPHAVLELQTVA